MPPSPHGSDPIQVVVAAATFRRPDCLTRLLPTLVDEVAAVNGAGDFTARALIVDNDPAGGAREQCAGWADAGVHYEHEPEPGIAAARNRALDWDPDATLLVFLDDDEVPRPGWLGLLLDGWQRWRSTVVVGPVVTQFEAGDVDPWVAACGVFDRTVRPDGALVGGAASNNLLLDLSQLRPLGLRFDPAYGLTGGSDTKLTHSIVRAGGQIRWCDRAEVLDYIPASRTTRAWVLQRTRRTGNVWSRVALELADGPAGRRRERLDLLARGGWRVLVGVARHVRGRLSRDVRLQATGATTIATGIGVLEGAVGRVRGEYLRPPTS